jgi:aryl-phospho-beta-D-glucosidase BglC (GH1 family)
MSLGREYGIKVIIDVHEAPGLKRWFLAEGEREDWRLWANSIEGENYRRALVNLWGQLSYEIRYAPADSVVFELLNEPVPRLDPENWADEKYGYIWENLQDRLVREIRRRDIKHLIIAAPPYSWRPNSLDAWVPSREIVKDKNTILAVHAFFPINYTYQWDAWSGKAEYSAYPGKFNEQFYGENYWDKEMIRTALEPIGRFYDKYGIRTYVSEFGVTKGAPGAQTWLADMAGAMNAEPAIWGWSAHVWGENEYALQKGIPWDPALGGMYDFASEPAQLDAILAGLKAGN